MKIKKYKSNKKNSNFLNNFYFLLIFFISFNKSELKKTKRNLILNYSEIRITFLKNGYNAFFSSYYDFLPTSIETQEQYNCNFTLRTCNVNNENNSIIINFNNINITSLENMFKNLINIKEIDLSNFDNSKVTNMKHMFYGCENLDKITFGNIDTSLVENIEGLFMYCYKLKIIDLSHFNTFSVINMKEMFSCCHNLESIIMSNLFNTSLVITMKNMFYQCWSLTSINLSNFDTSEVSDMSGMFYQNKKLINLDISNFNISKVTSIKKMFGGCDSLQYLNTNKFIYKEYINFTEAFPTNNKMIKFCINNDTNNNYLIQSIQDKIICSNTCFDKNNKYLDKVNNKCIKNCSSIRNRFEYEYVCYNKCPEFTRVENIISNKCISNKCNTYPFNINLCIENIPEGYYFNSSNGYYEKCLQNQNFRGCKLNTKLINNIKSINRFLEKYNEANSIREIRKIDNNLKISNDSIIMSFEESIINGSFNNIINNIMAEGMDYIISQENILYQVTTTENQKNNKGNISTINFGNCERTLKNKYNINISLPLIILKIDYFIPGILIPLIEYEVFHPLNKSKLDLSYCKNEVNLYIPVKIDENKIYQYNPNNAYYKDECTSYTSENGTDILLYDRKKEFINNNYSLCEMNCIYQDYDINTKRVKCSCKIKNNIEYASNPLILSQVFNIKEKDLGYANIFACTKKLFSFKKNVSNFILICSLFFYLLTPVFFVKCGYRTLLSYINDIEDNKIKFNLKQINWNNIINRRKTSNKIYQFNKNENGNLNLSKLNYDKKINYPPKKIGNRIRNYHSESINDNSSKRNIHNIQNHIFLNINYSKNIQNKNLQHNNIIKSAQISSKKNSNPNKIHINKRFKDCEMNSFNYSEAIFYDKRTCCQYYKSLLKSKQLLLFAFCPENDYNTRIIKFFIFVLSFNIHYACNLFYFIKKEIIHKIFEAHGKYDIMFFLPYIGISFAVSHIIIIIIKIIFLSDNDIIEIKKQKQIFLVNNTSIRIKKKLKIKYAILFILTIIFHLFLLVVSSSFSVMFVNTHPLVLKNALITFGISLIYPFFFNIIPSIFRFLSLIGKEKNHNIMYYIGKVFQSL